MRVISGIAKGRQLKSVPGTGTRPTTDKVKEAIFSMIGPYFEGGQVLDLFAGTGGLSIEALSRGMDHAVLTDIDKKSIDIIKQNLQATGFIEQAGIYCTDARRALKALVKREAKFDLVFVDPPYRIKLAQELLEQLDQHNLLNPLATIVVEHDIEDTYQHAIGRLQWVRRAEYGDTAVTIYKNDADAVK
ncbi:16S rRNA (guanine(966)-N(2))-methyltransferase RsmD [Paenibacillus sp. WQ 127069]|uniref:16S rRNA (Guanine(966)-N(2))-methyltransferase RsmD n=1 Tax=Paenibacillus baimaensis TaxID=2982185 RepID=A0ABT2UKW2_9BACL|nr:16S rRNA (guanine(966)-N(2))-methyltransferase RsmD [Paenibacillus sp. WQ 127069]MCU6795288.1 16S rRNA (guanine(966)-N(2))-methyltransferase RsmD [Paenibacillus sp. WQ 127069]